MKRRQICVIAFHMFLTCTAQSINSKTWIIFEQMENVDKQICMDSDNVFNKIQIFDKSACLHQCVSHFGCTSVFHGQYTGDCIGCFFSFDISNQPTGQADHLQYYWQPNCPDGWTTFTDSCYMITENRMDFLTGVATCQSMNARAVIIDNELENNFLKTLINSTIKYTVDDDAVFTGFTDMYTEATWIEYGTSNQMTFKDWANGEPTNSGAQEHCLVFYFQFNLQWVDISCSEEKRMMCERNI